MRDCGNRSVERDFCRRICEGLEFSRYGTRSAAAGWPGEQEGSDDGIDQVRPAEWGHMPDQHEEMTTCEDPAVHRRLAHVAARPKNEWGLKAAE